MLLTIRNLLDHTHTLLAYEANLAAATGESFNIFEILKIGSRELNTHSPILAELLSAQGRHGFGRRFLEIFISHLDLRLAADALVRQEHWAGVKTEDVGGRIDIVLTDGKGQQVLIENKIHAGDQEKQVSRYLNWAPHAQVLYLTLDGHAPTELSEAPLPERLRCISYETEILDWLQECRREATGAPLVRETITQYINLIKVLTGQNPNSRMQEQITNSILQSEASLEAYFALVRSQHDVIRRLLLKLEEQCHEIGQKLHLEVDFPKDLTATESGVYFFDPAMKAKNLCIAFQFQQRNLRSLNFGVAHVVAVPSAKRSAIADSFEALFGACNTVSWWPAVQAWSGRSDWFHDGTFQDIYLGKFKAELAERVKKLADIVRNNPQISPEPEARGSLGDGNL